MNRQLTVYSADFCKTVTRHVANLEREVGKLNDPKVVAKKVTEQNALEQYAAQIKADNETLNQLLYAKLLCCGRLGKLLPRQKGGRGNKTPVAVQEFSSHTLSTYRKIGDHFDQIQPWYAEVQKAFAEDAEAVERLHVATFLREVGEKIPTRVKRYTGNAEWYTPSEYIEAARKAMGGIDCDPASNAKAQRTVKAGVYYNAKENGLEYDWCGRVWLNPPYGRGIITDFCDKLIEELDASNISQAIVLTNNTTDTQWWHTLAERANRICFTKGRIKFLGEHNNTNGQTFLYYGNRCQKFAEAFSEFGLVFPPT